MPPGFSGFVEPGLSFSPEKTQIELACDVAASFGVRLPGGPITSLAKTALALAPVRAAVQTATASNDFLRIAYLLPVGTPGYRASIAGAVSVGPFLSGQARCVAPARNAIGGRFLLGDESRFRAVAATVAAVERPDSMRGDFDDASEAGPFAVWGREQPSNSFA